MFALTKKGLLSKNALIGKLIIRESFHLTIKKCAISTRRARPLVVKRGQFIMIFLLLKVRVTCRELYILENIFFSTAQVKTDS